MIELEKVIAHLESAGTKDFDPHAIDQEALVLATLTYLNAYKQVRNFLIALATGKLHEPH